MKTIDDLPELPFERLLSYLSLRDRLRLSAVSRSCHAKIANSRVKTLCYSELPIGRIFGKNRWISGPFVENFINSTRFESFFEAFGPSVLSTLKHLRLCDLSLDLENRTAFTRTLNSFGQLEQLDIIHAKCSQTKTLSLTLPMLTSIHLEELSGIKELTLNAAKLTKIRVLACCDLTLDIVHCESVESFVASGINHMTKLKELKNLKNLSIDYLRERDSTFLSSLQQLKEIHLDNGLHFNIGQLFEQKRHGLTDLKISICGLLLNGPDDPARSLGSLYLRPEALVQLAENPLRAADEIPFYRHFSYSDIERVPPGLEVELLKRFTELNEIHVDSRPVQDVQRFLNILKNFDNIVTLRFEQDQFQELFDRLSEHCSVQFLTIRSAPTDLRFLFRQKHLIYLDVGWSVDSEMVRKAFEELPVLSCFRFYRVVGSSFRQEVTIEIDRSKQFMVTMCEQTKIASDLNAAIQFAFGITK